MRQHFIYVLKKDDIVPGGGSTLGWLEYYKLNPENEEVFVPFTKEGHLARRGDVLWIMHESALLAWVPIERVQEDAINSQLEVWYDARTLCRIDTRELPEQPMYSTGILDAAVGESWFTPSRRSSP